MSNISIPKAKLQSQQIIPQQRKLKAGWSIEIAQDLQSLIPLDWSQEIDKVLENLARNAREVAEEEFRKSYKNKNLPRSIDDDWQVSRFD